MTMYPYTVPAVKPVEDPPPEPAPVQKPPAHVLKAAKKGQRELLVALRDKICAEIDAGRVPARDLASLSLRLITLAEQIAELDAKTTHDDIGTAAVTPDAAWPAA